MVSHELRTPLTSLTGLIQVTHSRLKDNIDPFLPVAMEKANLQVKRMSTMINGFLNISRLESAKLLLQKSEFNLTELIEEMIAENILTTQSHQIKFMSEPDVLVVADKEKIGSVVLNLISNAIKYSPQGNKVLVACKVVNDQAQVSVSDEGLGLSAEDQVKVFDRYFRVEGNATQHISGFGIGLYLSAEIINHHGGKIWVESTLGEGSTFYFSLPNH